MRRFARGCLHWRSAVWWLPQARVKRLGFPASGRQSSSSGARLFTSPTRLPVTVGLRDKRGVGLALPLKARVTMFLSTSARHSYPSNPSPRADTGRKARALVQVLNCDPCLEHYESSTGVHVVFGVASAALSPRSPIVYYQPAPSPDATSVAQK
jgi:hypothetical protein